MLVCFYLILSVVILTVPWHSLESEDVQRAELRSMQSSLQASKDDVAQDLQRNVFKK